MHISYEYISKQANWLLVIFGEKTKNWSDTATPAD